MDRIQEILGESDDDEFADIIGHISPNRDVRQRRNERFKNAARGYINHRNAAMAMIRDIDPDNEDLHEMQSRVNG